MLPCTGTGCINSIHMVPDILIYLFKANIALTLCYLAYRWGLRRLTFYTLNRIFLLAGIAIAALFPLVNVNELLYGHERLTAVATLVPDLQALQLPARDTAALFWWQVPVVIFWAGVTVMGIRLVIQLSSLLRMHRRSRPAALNGQRIRSLQEAVNPFSFFRHIYINPALHTPHDLTAILQHEQIHVRQWHSVDVLLGELNNICYWFNPGAWLMKTAIRENLEFITDRQLLRQGIDKKVYQYNLIKISGIPYATAIANNFNFSHLKNRIMMMNKKHSSRYHLLRYVVLGTVVGCTVLLLNYSRGAVHNGRQPVYETTADTAIKIPPAPPSPQGPPPPPPQKKRQVAVPKTSAAPSARQSTVKPNPRPAATPAPRPAVIKAGKAPRETRVKVPVSQSTAIKTPVEVRTVIAQPAVTKVNAGAVPAEVNVVTTSRPAVKTAAEVRTVIAQPAVTKVNTGTVPAEVSVVAASRPAVTKAGKASRAEVVKISEKPQPTRNLFKQQATFTYATASSDSTPGKTITIKGRPDAEPLYIIDDKTASAADVHRLKSESIETVNVLKGDAANTIGMYGEKAKNGVVKIYTKNHTASESESPSGIVSYYIDGVKASKAAVDALSPNDIATVNVIKQSGESKKKLAQTGGRVEIVTKKYQADKGL